MSPRILVAFILAIVVFAAFQTLRHSHASPTKVTLGPLENNVSASVQSNSTRTVGVTFDGSMLFQQRGNYYDVGITVNGHDFVIFKNETEVYPLETGSGDCVAKPRPLRRALSDRRKIIPERSTRWTLDVVNSAGETVAPNIAPRG